MRVELPEVPVKQGRLACVIKLSKNEYIFVDTTNYNKIVCYL